MPLCLRSRRSCTPAGEQVFLKAFYEISKIS
jgi:hypothetical protein